MPNEYHTLYELNEYIRRVVSLNFRDLIWIKAEVSQCKNHHNNFYIELVEKKEKSDQIIAQSQAVLWSKTYFFLKKKIGTSLDNLLTDGIELKIKVKVDFNEKYGLKLVIEDIDPSFTFGQVELKRRRIIEQIKNEDLHTLNKKIGLPTVIQKIAILSSPTAAGYIDFMRQLEKNVYNYSYYTHLYPIVVQGVQVENQLINALDSLEKSNEKYDCIVIVRGGGSRMDLSWFDSYKIGKKIAQCTLPIFTGIGHEIDYGIVDLVAHSHFKTPTAVAEYLIQHNVIFESNLLELVRKIKYTSEMQINLESTRLANTKIAISTTAQSILSQSLSNLEYQEDQLKKAVKMNINHHKLTLSNFEKMIELLSPQKILERGFAYLVKNKHTVTSIKSLKKGDSFNVYLKDGNFRASKLDNDQ